MTDIATARALLLRRWPLYHPLVCALRIIPDERIPTLGVSPDMVLVYNPKYLEQRTHEEGCALLWHEIQHVAETFVLHGACVFHGTLLNQGADLAINSRGRRIKLQLPGNLLFPEQYNLQEGLSTVEYCTHLAKNPPPPPPAPGSENEQEKGVGGGSCGLPPELLKEYTGLSPVQKSAAKEAFARAVQEHLSKGQGSLPGEWVEWVKHELAPPKVPWEQLLSTYLRGTLSSTAMRPDTDTWMRGHKRNYLDQPAVILRPGEESLSPEVLVIMDTSGSIGSPEFEAAINEIHGILVGCGAHEVVLAHADTRICKVERVGVYELLGDIEFEGRGGTSFVQPLEWATEQGAQCVVYITDGMGSFPAQAPPMPVFWVYLDRPEEEQAPFGVTIHVKL